MVRKKKDFYVVAYDIADDKRRNKVVKVLEKIGVRVNYSVFECMLTKAQFEKMDKALENIIDDKEDCIIFYPICFSCFSKITYKPNRNKDLINRIIVV